MTGRGTRDAREAKIGLRLAFVLFVMTASFCPAAPPAEERAASLTFDRISVEDLLPVLAEMNGLDLVATGPVPGIVSLSMEEKSLPSVLDDVLLGSGYTYQISGTLLRVVPVSTIVDITIPLDRIDAIEAKETITDIIGDAQIAADRRSNSITAVGPAGDVRRIEDALRSYDRPARQVQILSRMIEINVTDREMLGIDWGGAWGDDVQDIRGGTDLNRLTTKGVALNYSRLTDWELSAVLNAIETTTDAKIISRPMLFVSNQETSKILVGERVPYTRFTNETTSGGLQEEVDFIDVGIQLEVTPIISSDSTVIMSISAELSQVLDKEVLGIPRIGSREAHTRVAVRSGETAVIGGLRKEENTTTVRGIPWLSSIPYFGRLFRSEDEVTTQTELLIFLTPTLIDRPGIPDGFQTGRSTASAAR